MHTSLQPLDVVIVSSILFCGEEYRAMIPPEWFTAEKFAMGVCIYLLFRMEKTMGGLRDAVKEFMDGRERRGRNEHKR